MITRIVLRQNEYRDSVFLMVIKDQVMQQVTGVYDVAVMMGSQNNKDILNKAGYVGPELEHAGANDIVICLQAESPSQADHAVDVINQTLDQGTRQSSKATVYRTLDSLVREHPEINLALISIPGQYAARETSRALRMGMNVFLFSDNVPIEEEREIKLLANSFNRIVMGPDCGTAIINGIPLAFANNVKRGSVGVVAASGTGLQEFSVLLDREGYGISQAIGTGGRDLYDEIGGISTLKGIDILEHDLNTSLLVIISKPPQLATLNKLIERISQCVKPVVLCLLGYEPDRELSQEIHVAETFDQAVQISVAILKGNLELINRSNVETDNDYQYLVIEPAGRMAPEQQFIRGLYSGGSLCSEAMLVLDKQIGPVYSNIPLRKKYLTDDSAVNTRHTCIDLGSDEYTRGTPHPMISAEVRKQFIRKVGEDPNAAVLLLDIILGYGSHPDMAGSLKDSIESARDNHRKNGRNLVVVASVCGTPNDPQGFLDQVKKLEDVGVIVMPSNAKAAELAGKIILAHKNREKIL